MNTSFKLKKILIAPLDWGLGHATRCIPLIRFLLFLNCEVAIAASEISKSLLQTEFPELEFFDISPYNIVYSRKKRWMPFKIIIQIPKILKAIRSEHTWLQELLEKQHFDAIISDNRYGFYSIKITSVFITHQLQVNTSLKITKGIMRHLLYKHINHFHECWVPDFEGNLNMAGKLSHPVKFPDIPVKFIGPLSRFQLNNQQKSLYKYLVIISGPEPQRTIFEKKVLEFVKTCKHKFLVVLGKPGQKNLTAEISNCKICNHLTTKEMAEAFASSEFVVSRCGYTSVMEILSLQKKSILIPTPGQTEQEYLAKHLLSEQWCYTFLQNEAFDVHFKQAENFNYHLPNIQSEIYKTILRNLVSTL